VHVVRTKQLGLFRNFTNNHMKCKQKEFTRYVGSPVRGRI